MFRHFNSFSLTFWKKPQPLPASGSAIPCLETLEEIFEGCTILTEDPVISFPRFDDFHVEPLCTACFKVLRESVSTCVVCTLPLCGEDCRNMSLHEEIDCRLFSLPLMYHVLSSMAHSTRKFRKQLHLLIGVFRCLILKKLDPDKWELLEKLMTLPTQQEKMTALTQVDRLEHVGEILLTAKQILDAKAHTHVQCLDAPPGHEEMVRVGDIFVTIICVLTKFALCTWPENLESGMMSLMYTSGRILHDCNPNATAVIDANGNLKLVATRNLGQGTLVTIARHFSHSLWFLQGYHYRQTTLSFQFLSHEHCSLCHNSSDNNSGISCIKCSFCKQAYMIPMETKWLCIGCGRAINTLVMNNKLHKAFKFVEYYQVQKSVKCYDRLAEDIAEIENSLSPQHFVVLALKTVYMKQIYLYEQATDEQLKLILKFGDEIISVLNSVLKGISYYKGLISFYLHYAHEVMLNRVKVKSHQMNTDIIAYHWNLVRKYMIDVDRNWNWRQSHTTLQEEKDLRAMLARHYETGLCSPPKNPQDVYTTLHHY